MYKINYFLFLTFCLFLTTSCSNDEHNEVTDTPGSEIEEKDPSGSFDYSKIPSHPRILLTNEGLEKVREATEKSPELKSIHDYILSSCDEILTYNKLEYKKEGKRLLAVSRDALKRIFYLSYGYRMTGKNSYLIRAETELNAVCSFSDWNPSHFLDVGEMTMAVAIGYDWLYDVLQDETKKKIQQAILNKAFTQSKNSSYNWFLTSNNNWNQVCNAGLVYGALAIYEEAKESSVEIIERCLKTNTLPLEAYGPDGNYPEGYSYWGYGTSFQVMLFAALDQAFGSDNNLSATPGFLKTPEYMLFMSGPAGYCFNYSDCASSELPKLPMFWFAEKLNNPALLYNEVKMLNNGAYTKSFDELRLLPALLIFAKDLNLSDIPQPSANFWKGDGITPVVLIRTGWNGTEGKYLGIKGGKASTSHAHMDAGSFVFDAYGQRWAMDLGLQSYITLESAGVDLWNMSQESQRWDVFRLSNRNHNTLTIDNQRHVVDGNCSIAETYTTADCLGAKLNMSEVFRGQLQSATRTIQLINDEQLVIEDHMTTLNKETSIRWNIVTPANATITDGQTIELTQNGTTMNLKVESPNGFILKTWTTTSTNSYDQENPETIIVGFEATVPASANTTFKVTLSKK